MTAKFKLLEILNSLLYLMFFQGSDNLIHIAIYYLIQAVKRQVNSVISHSILWKIISSDLLASVS